jgi:hypothetical protein|tara:strand:- start:736 stop:930 length:195 start_codon:yes stop_codon:yes gene_type:complete
MKLYNIFYIDETYGVPPKYECTTNNFEKWLKQHNKKRVADGFEKEEAGWFNVEEISPIIFNDDK